MAKRRAAPDVHEEFPIKRRTRHSGLVLASLPTVSDSPKKRGRPPGKRAAPRPALSRSKGQLSELSDDASLKENIHRQDHGVDTIESDELNLSPENRLPPDRMVSTRRAAGKSAFMDYVHIETPPKLTRFTIQSRVVSPCPNERQKPTKTSHPSQPVHVSSPSKCTLPTESTTQSTPAIKPKSLPRTLPPHLHACLTAQKRAILGALQSPPSGGSIHHGDHEEEYTVNSIAVRQLTELLTGTAERGEGNSCLMIGPKGSGKSRIFEQAISSLPTQPIIIRLSGHVQHNDRLAMREIARQIRLQAGTTMSLLPESLVDDDDNPSVSDHADGHEDAELVDANLPASLPPPSHLPSLISTLPNLSRPVVVLLDAFDLFTGHARQALLYCLLDTVQSCRSATGPGSSGTTGLAVIGATARVDVVNLLEKRVKSRFSHRILRTAGMGHLKEWTGLLRRCLDVDIETELPMETRDRRLQTEESIDDVREEWRGLWCRSVDQFLEDRALKTILRDTFGISRDVRLLTRIMTGAILDLRPKSPFLSAHQLQSHVVTQRNPPRFPLLSTLSYPSICLLIAAQHVRTSGHDTFTFEMLHESFRDQVRTSAAAPVVVGGNGIGMVNVGRGVVMGAFEQLVRSRIFRTAATAGVGFAPEFVKHRCNVDREEVKAIVERIGQTHLKKWLNKAQ